LQHRRRKLPRGGGFPMNPKKILILSLVAVFAIGLAARLMVGHKTEIPAPLEQVNPPPAVSESTPPVEIPTIENKLQIQPVPADIPVIEPAQTIARTAPPPLARHKKAPIQDPIARAALSSVGADPDADKYWMNAINDPTLPAEERKDLIEDLNEDGLSDPKNPGPQDLPLIVNRLKLIERLAPQAMDKVNSDAFAEARKDLENMLAGEPVP
jgi:hypothetical protein